MVKKKKSTLPDITKQDPLTPFSIENLGTNGDPCFGQGYDLTTKECKLCGDSELCAFKMSQQLHITRKELEEKNKYKDIDNLEDVKGIKKYIRGLKRKGLKRKEIVEKTSIKFESPKEVVRKIYKELKESQK
jgi:hypothetical protein